eukprot:scaffold80210_cov34-Tisochrysis_lutea.AAC.3
MIAEFKEKDKARIAEAEALAAQARKDKEDARAATVLAAAQKAAEARLAAKQVLEGGDDADPKLAAKVNEIAAEIRKEAIQQSSFSKRSSWVSTSRRLARLGSRRKAGSEGEEGYGRGYSI